MKTIVTVLIVLIILGAGGYFGFQYLSKASENSAASQSFQTEAITRTGMLQKASSETSDFTHVILSQGKSYGVTSRTVNLDQYVGKNVEATGQNSGTTLYVDSIKEIP